MTRTSDESRIRFQNEAAPTGPPGHVEIKILLRLLDEARAYGEQMQRERNEAYAKFHKAEDKIVRLQETMKAHGHWCQPRQAPPGAPAMERAREAWRSIQWSVQLTWPQSEVDKVLTVFARAIEQAEAAATEKERQRCGGS